MGVLDDKPSLAVVLDTGIGKAGTDETGTGTPGTGTVFTDTDGAVYRDFRDS